jgi:hypothetical protein
MLQMDYKLNDAWVLTKDTHFQNITSIQTVDTISSFWTLFNSIPKVNDISYQVNLRLFRKDCAIISEAKENIDGGRWQISMSKPEVEASSVFSKLFEFLACDAIGETFGGLINGVILNVRSRGLHRISLWTSSCDHKLINSLEKSIKETCKSLNEDFSIEFQKHTSNFSQNKYIS